MSCAGRIRRRARSRSCAHTRRPTATWRSPTRARSRTSIRLRITREKCSATPRPAIVRDLKRNIDSPGEFLILTAAGLPHLGFRIPLGNQPRADAGRHIAHFTAMKVVQSDPVELRLARSFFDSDFHLVSKQSKHDAEVNARA